MWESIEADDAAGAGAGGYWADGPRSVESRMAERIMEELLLSPGRPGTVQV